MLFAEDLLLLVTDDASGRLTVPAAAADAGLAGANLLELALMNQVGLSGEHDGGKRGRIVVRDPAPPGTQSSTPPCRSSSPTREASQPR